MYYPILEAIYAEDTSTLVNLNNRLLTRLLSLLEIDTSKVVNLSDIHATGRACDLVVNTVTALGGKCYLSGVGARDYNDPRTFADNGIKLVYMDFTHPCYRQDGYDDFVSGLSIVDLLFNYGPESLDIIRRDNMAFERSLRALYV